MERKYLIVNWILFIIFTFLLGWFIKPQLEDGYILFNEAIAMFLFCLSFPLKIYNINVARYVILVVLLVLLFSPLSYEYTITEESTSVTHQEARFTSLISPVTFLVLMLFLAFNCQAMIDLYHLLIRGSEKEQKAELSKNIEFYYAKFNDCSNAELADILKMYDDYPVEAQVALKKIKDEKDIN